MKHRSSASVMRQAAAPGCFSDRPLSSRGRCTALPSRPVLPAVRPRRHAAQAAQPAGGQGAGGRGARRRRRESVTFLVPARADPDLTQPMRATHVTQRSLDNFLDKMNALGFYTARGGISRQLEDLPEGGTVQLFLSPVPSIAEQVCPPGCPVPCSSSTAGLQPAAREEQLCGGLLSSPGWGGSRKQAGTWCAPAAREDEQLTAVVCFTA